MALETTPAGTGNILINTDGEIAQRGTVFTTTDATPTYTLDGWRLIRPTTLKRVVNTSPAPTNYAIRAEHNDDSNTSTFGVNQLLETPKPAGVPATLCFWARGHLEGGTNLAPDTLRAAFKNSGATVSDVFDFEPVTDEWRFFCKTVLGYMDVVQFTRNASDDPADWFEVVPWLVYGGLSPFPWEDTATKLLRCRKRFWVTDRWRNGTKYYGGMPVLVSSSRILMRFDLPVPMRAIPTAGIAGERGPDWVLVTNTGVNETGTVSFSSNANDSFLMDFTGGSYADQLAPHIWIKNTNAYVWANADI
jgi:hypothetical protein